MNRIVNKNFINFLLASALFLGSFSCAYAIDTVRAYEIVPSDEIEDKNAQTGVFVPVNNSLGGDYYKTNINLNKPEVHIKSIGEIIDEKKLAKEKAEEEAENKVNKEEDLIINCNEMEYFDERNELEAREKVEIITPSGAKAYADKAIYNKDNNTIKLLGNVSLLKGNATVDGEYMLIDLNEENALMDEPSTKIGTLTINAKEGYAYSDKIENLNGNVELNKKIEMELYSTGFSAYGRAINDTRLVDFELKKERSKPYKFKTKEIEIRPEKDHDSMIMKNVDIYYGKRKVLNVPSIEIFSDKELTYTEANYPIEFGSIKGLGAYLGLGYTFKLPKTFTFRAMPALVYGESEFGLGLIGQLKSKKTRTEVGWATNTNNLIFDGEYKVTNTLKLDLARHVYKNEWFNGGNRAGYLAELVFDDSYPVRELGNAVYRHRITGGYVADYEREHQEDNMRDGFRYRYQGELSKSLRTFGSKEQDMFLDVSALGQVMATLYTETGDTPAFFRFGPSITSKVKRWNSNITYTMGGVHGRSPYKFDEYRYGRQTIAFDESIICNKFLSLGYKGTLSPLKDNTDKDILTENRFYAVAGPEDIKIVFSYDTIRQNMYFDFLFLLGTDNLDMKFDKLTVKNPDKIGKRQKKESDRELNKIKVPEDL